MMPLIKLIDKTRLEDVCSKQALEFVEYCAHNLPFSSYNMMEVRLKGKQQEVDLSINYQRLPLQVINTAFNKNNWQPLQSFFDRWNTTGTLEQAYVNDIWVELDFNKPAEVWPILFCTITGLPKTNTNKVISFIESCFGLNLTDNRKLLIAKLLQPLPAWATISHIAYMQNRHNQPLRFNIKKLNIDTLAGVLHALGVTNREFILQHCARYIPLCDSFTLAVDISEMIEPRIGIEFFFAWQQRDYPKITAFINQLENDGLTETNRARAIKNWPMIDIIQPDDQNYPENLRRLSRFMYPDVVCSFWNIINHIKLVFERDSVEAKAYLAYGHSCDAMATAAQNPAA